MQAPGEASSTGTWWERGFWRHAGWGLLLALVLVVGDIRTNPGSEQDVGDAVGSGATSLFFIATFLVGAVATLAFGLVPAKRAWMPLAGAVVLGIITAIIVGDLYTIQDNGDGGLEAPLWRDALLPSATLLALGLGTAAYFKGDARGAEVLLLAGMVGTALVPYAQQRALLWAAILALAVTYAWLVPRLSPFCRYAGLAMHAIALIGFVQYEPAWFAWTPFPFLTLYPVFIIAQYLRVPHGPVRRATWWAGLVVAGGSTLLGLSTLIGRILDDLPVMESIIMLAAGAVYTGLLLALWKWRPAEDVAPATA